jgi:hypothetical protein
VRGIFLGIKGDWDIMLTTSPPSLSQFSRKYRSVNTSELYVPPWPVVEIP